MAEGREKELVISRRLFKMAAFSYLQHCTINTSHYKAYLYDAQRHCTTRQVQTRPGTSGHVHPPFALCTRSSRAPLACAARSSTLQRTAVRRCSSARLGSFLAGSSSSFSLHSCCPPVSLHTNSCSSWLIASLLIQQTFYIISNHYLNGYHLRTQDQARDFV